MTTFYRTTPESGPAAAYHRPFADASGRLESGPARGGSPWNPERRTGVIRNERRAVHGAQRKSGVMKKRTNGARKVSRAVLFAAAGGVVLLAVGALWAGGAFSSGPEIDPSRLAAAESGDIARSVVATGKIEPLAKVEVKSKASGIVKELLVDYGDKVKTGQKLVELDKEELQARVREAQATLTAARAAEEASRAALERDTIEAEGPDIPYLRSAVERAKNLHDQGIVSVSVLEDADKAYQLALNKQAAALRTIAVARAEVSRAAAQVAQTRAALERAQTDLQNSTILSPMDG